MATSLAVGGKEDDAVFFWLSFALSLYLTAFFYAPLQSHMRIISTQFSMSIPQFIVPHFIVPHRCFALYKLKTGPATSKMITTHFIAMVWSIYLRYACIWSWRDIFWRLAEMCFVYDGVYLRVVRNPSFVGVTTYDPVYCFPTQRAGTYSRVCTIWLSESGISRIRSLLITDSRGPWPNMAGKFRWKSRFLLLHS